MNINDFSFVYLFLLPIVWAFICFIVGKTRRLAGAYSLIAAAWEWLSMLLLGSRLLQAEATLQIPGVLGLGLSFSMKGLQFWLCMLACTLWLGSTLAGREQLVPYGRIERYHFFSFLTLGGILGVFMSADLYTTLVFFELMSFASWPLVQHSGTKEARRAADSYLAFAVIGGLTTLMGLFLLHHLTGTLSFEALEHAALPYKGSAVLYTAGALTAFGFASKAAVYPLHTWLPTAHPAAPAPASALLSGIITKAGIYGLAFLSAGLFAEDAGWSLAVLLFGTVTMFTGALLALFSINLKRTLACSSMSQIGFILIGLGMQGILGEENAIAVAGLTLHITNHALFKLCLFLCAGVIATQIHHLELEQIRGFGRGKPLLMFAFLMGGVGLAGVPLFSGYISKTLLHESIVEQIHLLTHHGHSAALFSAVEWIFLISGGMTAAYMTKLFICLFVEKNRDPKEQEHFDSMNGKYCKPLTAAVLAAASACIPLMGSTAHLTMDRIAGLGYEFFHSEGLEHEIAYFSLTNLKGSVISLTIGAVLYLGFVRPLLMEKKQDGSAYVDRWPYILDIENHIYRPLLNGLAFWSAAVARLVASLFGWGARLVNSLVNYRQGKTVYIPTDERFSIYEAEPAGRYGFKGSLAFSLLMICIGFGFTMLYLIFRLYMG